MKTIVSALRYHAAVYLRTARYVPPFLAFLVLLAGAYGTVPVQVVNSFAFSMSAIFFVMIAIGMTYADAEDIVSEQLLILRFGCPLAHYIANAVFLFLIGAAFSLFATLYPLVLNILIGFALYKRPVTAADAVWAFVLHCFVAYMGGAVGALFHPRIVRDRKLAMLLATTVAVVGFTKIGIHRILPIAAAVTWVFPPMSDIADMLAGQPAFTARHIATVVGVTALYGTFVNAAQIALLVKRKF